MSLRSLKLRDFRNYRDLDLELTPEITVITGKNGIGKTSILEAIALLGSARSFRNARNQDFIHKDQEFAQLTGDAHVGGLFTNIKIRIYPQGKKVFLDDKLAKSTEPLLELLPAIVFSPSDHRIVEGDSNDRKQFLNRAVANVDWDYVEDLSHYTKALQQRNRVLKDASAENWNQARIRELLGVWDEQLVLHGSRVLLRRHFYLTELSPKAREEYQRISLSEDEFGLLYQPLAEEDQMLPEVEGEVRGFFSKKLQDSLRRDLASGNTQVGPHKDEILLTLNGNKVKFYGSQGEKRTCALALRLGELALFRAKIQKPPVLLFDDVSSELDKMRRQSLVELLRKENTQVLITATELPFTLMGDVGKDFEHLDLNTVGVRD